MMNSSDSKRRSDVMECVRAALESRLSRFILICLLIVVCCASLVRVAEHQSYMLYDASRVHYAVAAVLAFSTVGLLFVFARFSFGYFAGFYLYTMVLGFIWLSCFTRYDYDHKLAGVSAAISMLLFLLPALLINAPIKQLYALPEQAFERLLRSILVLAVLTIGVASTYNFKIISVDHIYDFRAELSFPTILRYSIGIVSNVLLPFAFAAYLTLNHRWWAGVTLLLLLLFYPVTLTKFAFFAPVWIVTLLILSKIVECRLVTILPLLLTALIGVVSISTYPSNEALKYFNTINIRMLATPSSAMDIYNDFFANHPLTYFCQISFLKALPNCPYQEPLSVVMEKAYGFGKLNASLFATEGIASVGLYFAPLAALACGLVIGIANRLSAGLPPRFVLVSGALLPQALVNVPFTTVLLTHGAVLLFLLWYITPRATSASAAARGEFETE